MSPKSPRSAPYPRRGTGQPKSSRQQFSACGACRMRRVRCDLKDLPANSSPGLACSNCRERGLKCVDEFADVKAVKLLRRGRRLQQVEAIYGKVADDDHSPTSPSAPTEQGHLLFPAAQSATQPAYSSIPPLKPALFTSRFWRRFCMQRPFLTDFPARYFNQGSHPLPPEGRLLAMVLVALAGSFGVDEAGNEVDPASLPFLSSMTTRRQAAAAAAAAGSSSTPSSSSSVPAPIDTRHVQGDRWRVRTDGWVKEILAHVDACSVLRKPTWDGVRVLLLVLSIAEDVQTPLERLAMYEAAQSQVHALASLSSHSASSPPPPPPSAFPSAASSSSSPLPSEVEAEVRTRVLWYVHVHEAMCTGLRGGRLAFEEGEMEALLLPPPPPAPAHSSISISLPVHIPLHVQIPPSPISPTFPHHSEHHQPHHHGYPPTSPPTTQAYYHHSPQTTTAASLIHAPLFALPLRLGSVCRRVHEVLTGPRAVRRENNVSEEGMLEVWEGLDVCWEEFEMVRRNGGGSGGGVGGIGNAEEVERFVAGWQIFIFECHNLIREALKQRLLVSQDDVNASTSAGAAAAANATAVPSPPHSHHSPARSSSSNNSYPPSPAHHDSAAGVVQHLHALARRKCRALLPLVLALLRRHLQVQENGEKGPTGLFKWDAGFVRDGCFFAGFLVAGGDREEDGEDESGEEGEGETGGRREEEAMEVCLRAMSEMRWAFSKSEERERMLRMIWESRRRRKESRRRRSREAGVGVRRSYVPEYAAAAPPSTYEEPAVVYGKMMSHQPPHHPAPLQVHHHHHHLQHSQHPLGHGGLTGAFEADRPMLPPPLTLLESHHHAPPPPQPTHWVSYTPPATASTAPGSPVYQALSGLNSGGFKTEGGGGDFYGSAELDASAPFDYSPPMTADSVASSDLAVASATTGYCAVGQRGGMGYLETGLVFDDASCAGASGELEDGCGQFSGECHQAYYHH